MTNSFTRSDGVNIDLIRESHCKVCSKPIPLSYKDYGYCMDCKDQKDLEPELIIYGVTEYIQKDPVERLSIINREIREFKHDRTHSKKLGECLVHVITHRYPHLLEANLIVPVPSSNTTRGYNPATLLAEYVSAATGIPCEDLLSKDPASPRQHEQPAGRKCVDIVGTIRPKKLTDARTVLLIDDTIISGCTMRECARVLKENGAFTVYGLAVGRGIDRKRLEYLEKEDARHG